MPRPSLVDGAACGVDTGACGCNAVTSRPPLAPVDAVAVEALVFDRWRASAVERLAFVVVFGDLDDDARRVRAMPPVGRDTSPPPKLGPRCFFVPRDRLALAAAAVAEALPAGVPVIGPRTPTASAFGSALGSFVAASAFPATGVVEAPGVVTVGVVP
jgi:hypothetical protein